MANLIKLYEIRKTIGINRQPQHRDVLLKLDDVIKNKNLLTSFDIRQKERTNYYSAVNGVNEYNSGSKGFKGKVDSEYIYRLTTMKKIASSPHLDWRSSINTSLNETEFNQEVLKDIKHKRKNYGEGEWLNLNLYAGDYLNAYRNFSFWTSYEFSPSDIYNGTFKIGFGIDWITQFAVILRCKYEKIKNATEVCVPTIIDAFDMPIFHPVVDNHSVPPLKGQAIDIGKNPLSLGVEEFVVGSIKTDDIEFTPVILKSKKKRGITFKDNRMLWSKLELYYNNL